MTENDSDMIFSLLELHDFEAEEELIGSFLYDPALLPVAIDNKLTVADFGNERVGWVFTAICEVAHANGGFIDVPMVAQSLRMNGKLDDVGGEKYLNTITTKAIAFNPLKNFAGKLVRVKSLRLRRLALGRAGEIAQVAYDMALSMDDIELKVHNLARDIVNPWPDTSNLQTFQAAAEEDWKYTDKLLKGEIKPGMETQFSDLDYATNGHERGDLTIVGGPTSSGKSSLLWQDAMYQASQGRKVLYIPLEMPNRHMIRRGLVQATGVGNQHLRAKAAGANAAFEKYTNWLRADADKYNTLWLCRLAGATLRQIKSIITNAVDEYDIDIVYIDYLQLIAPEDKNRTQSNEMISNSLLNDVALLHNIAVVTASQLRRMNGQRPGVDDLRWGGLEQAATKILIIHPSIDTEDEEIMAAFQGAMLPVTIILAKNRNGIDMIDIPMLWHRKKICFQMPPKKHQLSQEA